MSRTLELGVLAAALLAVRIDERGDLVHARVGKQVVEAHPRGRFAVTAVPAPVPQGLDVTFPTMQRYDFALRDNQGQMLWKCSDGLIFGEGSGEMLVSGEYSVTTPVPLPPNLEQPPADYSVSAWLTTVPSGPQFAATAPVVF